MKKEELVDLTIARVSNESYQIHPELISRYIALGYNDIFYAKFLRYINLGIYCKRTLQTVKLDEDLDIYYCEIPQSTVSLPAYPDGIYRITEKKGNLKITFIPVAHQAMAIFQNLEVSHVTNSVYFSSMDGRIEFARFNNKIKEVLVYYLPSFEVLEDEDDIPLPSGKAMDLVGMVTQFVIGKVEPKMSNDNAKTI